ncbi:hypothetical protein [Parageobacillus thermoglucosidasius]|nr:hypothetical protein [Parageobacillus thermoglucosidasius]
MRVIISTVANEVCAVLSSVKKDEALMLADELQGAKRIFVLS